MVPKKYLSVFVMLASCFALWGLLNNMAAIIDAPGFWAKLVPMFDAVVDSDPPRLVRLAPLVELERAKKAYAVVLTGETAKYGNIIIKKGVVPVPSGK